VGNAGSEYGELRTAIRTGSYHRACEIARDLPHLKLTDALTITLMALEQVPLRFERLARRWLEKFITEVEPELGDVVYAGELLRDLREGHERAVFEAIKPMLQVKLASKAMRGVAGAPCVERDQGG
jgi:hypothetical protein